MVADTLPRRLAAILHLDVVEFSRLTHDNEDATYRTLQNYLRCRTIFVIWIPLLKTVVGEP